MKQRGKFIAIAFLIVALLVLAWLFHPVKQTTVTPLPPVTTNLTAQETFSINNVTNTVLNPGEMDWSWTNKVPMEKRAWMIDRIKKLMATTSVVNAPIIFYGRVVDQFGQPIDGVQVVASYNTWNVPNLIEQRPGRQIAQFSSDTDGVFVVKGIRGSSMTITLERDGYELAPHSEVTFAFDPGAQNPHIPNPTNPVVYHMWKRTGAAELVGRNFEHRIRADGTPVSLDLIDEKYVGYPQGWKTVTGTDKFPGPTIRVWREPFHYDPWQSPVKSWRYELIIPGGKIQTTEDVFCYLAPSTGYKDKLLEAFDANTAGFVRKISRRFYFVNQQGQYGCGSIEIAADYVEEEAFASLSVCWNPDGSRNLEPKAP